MRTLAEVGGAPVGLALFYYTLNTFRMRPNIFLEDLFVEPAHRGTGIGLALMRHLAHRARGGELRPDRMARAELEPAFDRLLPAYRCQTDRELAHTNNSAAMRSSLWRKEHPHG